VWRKVARAQEQLGARLGRSVTADASKSSLQLTLESGPVRQAVAPYLDHLATAPDGQDDVIGCVVVVNGRVVAADVYASGTLFRKLWPKLLEGGAVEAVIETEPGRSWEPAGEDAVRTFLLDAEDAPVSDEAVTERTYVQVRRSGGVVLVESCDRARANLVLHRSFLVREGSANDRP